MKIQEVFDSVQTDFSALIEVNEKLEQINEENYQETMYFILRSKFMQDKEQMYKLLCCINAIIYARPLQLQFYVRLISSMVSFLRKNFTSSELALIFTNKRIILLLVREKLIDIRTLINFFVDDRDTLKYFCEELQSEDSKWYKSMHTYYTDVPEFLNKFDKQEHHKLRKEGQNEDVFAEAIRSDDIDKFQDLMAFSNHPINSKIGPSIYESNNSCKDIKLIEYAALCGSLNIFKFLWMNLADLTYNLLGYAVAGGNYEIVHIVESKRPKYTQEALQMAIQFHRNDLVHYIIETADIEMNLNILFTCISSFNYEIFQEYAPSIIKDVNEIQNDITMLHAACQCGNIDVVNILVQIPELDPNIRDKNGKTSLHIAARGGYMNIVKSLVKFTNVNIEARDKMKNSPLHLASLFCRLDVVMFLATLQKIDVNAVDRVFSCFLIKEFILFIYRSAYLIACQYGFLDIVKFLIRVKGVDKELKDKSGVISCFI